MATSGVCSGRGVEAEGEGLVMRAILPHLSPSLCTAGARVGGSGWAQLIVERELVSQASGTVVRKSPCHSRSHSRAMSPLGSWAMHW